MKRKCVWKNKNGFAMETAIWFILVISALCFLMTSVAMFGHYQTRLEAEELKRELQINQIGEYYIQSIKAGTVKNDFRDGNYGDGGGYRYSIENNELRVWRTRGNGDTILYVKAEFQENEQRTKDVKILSWKYALPSDEELDRWRDLDRIGEQYIASLENQSEFSLSSDDAAKYELLEKTDPTPGIATLKVVSKDDPTQVVLFVEARINFYDGHNKVDILSWKYGFDDPSSLTYEITLDRIGEEFINTVGSDQSFFLPDTYGQYSATVSRLENGNYVLLAYSNLNQSKTLYVEAALVSEEGSQRVEIVTWKYYEPIPAEVAERIE